MKNWMIICNMAALVFLIIILKIVVSQTRLYEDQYNEQRLIRASEYAAEAAFYSCILSDDDNVNYTSQAERVLAPKDALSTFDLVMALNYDMALDETSYSAIEDSIGVMCLIANDGYYLANVEKQLEDNNGTDIPIYKFVWSAKLPYSSDIFKIDADETNNDKISGLSYGVTLYGEQCYLAATSMLKKDPAESNEHLSPDKNTTHRKEDVYTFSSFSGLNSDGQLQIFNNNVASGVTMDDVEATMPVLDRNLADRIVSTALTDAISFSADYNTRIRDLNSYNVYIPTTQTQSGINDVKYPTLLVILKDAEYADWTGTLGATLAGFQVTDVIKTICYTDNGQKLYCYEGQGAIEELRKPENQGPSFVVDKMLSSFEEAAENGYNPDYRFIFNPISIEGIT